MNNILNKSKEMILRVLGQNDNMYRGLSGKAHLKKRCWRKKNVEENTLHGTCDPHDAFRGWLRNCSPDTVRDT